MQLDDVRPYVDAAITFEELQALLDSRDIDITTLTESEEQRLEQEYTPDSLLNEYKTERKKKLKGSV